MKKKWLMLLVALMMLASIFVGCTKVQETGEVEENKEVIEASYPMTVVDGLGNTVTINAKPETFISIDPSQTEILYALGLQDKLLAVSDFCDYPVEAKEKEKVGSAWGINVEKVIELEPDVVFVYGEGQPDAVSQMEAAGITVLINDPTSIAEIFNAIETAGKIAGVETKANELIMNLEERRDAIVEKVKNQPKVKAFYQVWDEPLMTAGPGSFIDEIIQLAGGENIAADATGAWPTYSVESLVENNPDVYIAPAHVGENMNLTQEEQQQLIDMIKAKPGYGEINAMVNDRVELMDPNIMSRPGVRIIDALEMMAKVLHPDLF